MIRGIQVLIDGRCGAADGTQSGAETLVQGYLAKDLHLARRVRGEYTFLLYDENRRTLVLGHDPLGLGAAFYSTQVPGSSLVVGSAISALSEWFPALKPDDEEYLADRLALALDYQERTPYRAIRRLEPATNLLFSAGRAQRIASYPFGNGSVQDTAHQPDASGRLLECLTTAVDRAVPQGREFLCDLSGGLDSSTVFCLAADAAPQRTRAFSILYSQSPQADESEWIRTVLEERPQPWSSLDADRYPPFGELPGGHHAEPNRAVLLGSYYQAFDQLLDQAAIDTVLTGQGGDAVLYGDQPEPYYLADLLTAPRALRSELAKWSGSFHGEQRPAVYWFKRYALASVWRRWRGQRVAALPMPLPDWIRPEYAHAQQLDQRRRRGFGALAHNDHASRFFWERVLLNAQAASIDLNQREGTCHYAHPLMDLDVVECVASQPPSELFDPKQDRRLHRRAMQGILPRRTLARRGKSGSDECFFRALNRSPEWIEYLTQDCELAALGCVDIDAWTRAVEQARVGFCASPAYFWTTCVLEAWLKSRSGFDAG